MRDLRWLLLAAASCASDFSGAEEQSSAFRGADVGVDREWKLPIVSASGIARHGSTLFVVSDDSPDIVSLTLAEHHPRVRTHDVSSLIGAHTDSEAIACDDAGNLFLLDEEGACIHGLSADLTRSRGRAAIVFPTDHPLATAWLDEPNSRGEGMVLLSNGHVLLAKEKAPAAIVELAPFGEAPVGFRPDLVLRGEFPWSARELVATAYWLFGDADRRHLGDISDLAVDEATSELVLLSDQGRAIAVVGRSLDPAERSLPVGRSWRLPSNVKKPEGLVIRDGRAWVSIDEQDTSRPALFELGPLPDLLSGE